ncbi:hypothetical protein E1B28_011894 [Marasmius oreades]|uniref:Uncharacterized protein n=1 Tax=Marasmius oreades TaxID=181124 RepID=A0A9P7RV78_9AGAR|nr:uncharacterized protein E1B28_011894 [Marasmius oreades]KAG7090297.1 hypothetical protein E1B28_011894 [Marasmius oreades]
MANPDGHNGYSNGEKPMDDDLKEALRVMAPEMLREDQARARLKAKFNYAIGRSKYFQLLKKFYIPTACKNSKAMPPEVIKTVIIEKLDDDISGRSGPNTIQNRLSRDHVPLPRDTIRAVMKEVQEPGAARGRMPGYGQPKIARGHLLVIGPFQEIHTDGFEKFARQALQMGAISIGVYGFRDHIGFIHMMKAVPDARDGAAVGHLHLDMIVAAGHRAAVQMTYDLGHETKEMRRQQHTIREQCSSLDPNEVPVVWETKSTHNIVIESTWKWLRQYIGKGIREIIEEGKTNGLFCQSNPNHVDLFHWLFPKLIQSSLDDFVAYWNSHKVRRQTNSPLPSGVTPRHVMECPEEFGLVSGAINVPVELIAELRAQLPPHDEVFQWVDNDFDAIADVAFRVTGSPSLVGPKAMRNAWTIFGQMAEVIAQLHCELQE